MLHWFPAKVFKPSLDWNYSFWLGTISAALLLLLVVSGLPLLFLYVPSVERAYGSVKDIEWVVTFGSWIRSVHRLSAHLMVAAVFLHLVRVFLTGAYKNGAGRGQRREWNWVMGVAMLLLTLFLSFTGYLLPWDQLAFWAVTVGTNIAASIPFVGPQVRELLIGGRAIDQATLLRFYVLHIIVLPGSAGRALRLPHVARAQGRRPRPRRPRGAPAREDGRGRGPDQDLHAARRRPRHRPDHPRRDARGARPHGERGPRPRAPGRDRCARHLRRDQRAVVLHPLPARGGGQSRWSRRTRPRPPGTSCGSRRS